MKQNKLIIILVIVAVVTGVFFVLGPLYIVNEGEQAVLIRFGQIVQVETDAGLKFKTPVIDNVHTFPKKILSWDGEPQRIPTAENQFIWVDTTARWRIVDPPLFYERITTLESAYGRLDDVIDSAVRAVIADHRIAEAVRSTNQINEQEPEDIIGDSSQIEGEVADEESFRELLDMIAFDVQHDNISKGRSELSQEMLENSRGDVSEYGIELIDVVIRQIRYSDDLTEAVFNRMISERQQIAEGYRSYGDGRREELLGQLERERETILSEAEAQAQEVRAIADGEAARIYNEAYGQDQNFFEFWRSLEAYKGTMPNLNKILSTEMDFFRFLYNPEGS
ncbi:MAG: protease modulator HflC [Spirochaeta sp.]